MQNVLNKTFNCSKTYMEFSASNITNETTAKRSKIQQTMDLKNTLSHGYQ